MSVAVILDAGPLGLLTNPNQTPQPLACKAWLASLYAAKRRIIVPEIADYEVRRELLRIQSHSALVTLDAYSVHLEYLPLTTTAIRQAAELWAQLRQAGLPTASTHALDCDVILVAQAMGLNTPFVIASDNLSHLTRIAPAELWSNISP